MFYLIRPLNLDCGEKPIDTPYRAVRTGLAKASLWSRGNIFSKRQNSLEATLARLTLNLLQQERI